MLTCSYRRLSRREPQDRISDCSGVLAIGSRPDRGHHRSGSQVAKAALRASSWGSVVGCVLGIFLNDGLEASLPLLRGLGTAFEMLMQRAHPAASHFHVANQIE